MALFSDDGTVQIHHGDSRELLAGLKADVIVTDPPYGLAFMGKAWDKPYCTMFHQRWAEAAYQALPPGGWLLAFGGTRTWHRLACGIEDAGFEIRDTLMWLQGQGFPKGKACLKPGWEPILLARKPGASVLQIDTSRIAHGSDVDLSLRQRQQVGDDNGWRMGKAKVGTDIPLYKPSGRWPANVVVSHGEGCQQVGVRKVRSDGHSPRQRTANRIYGSGNGTNLDGQPEHYMADPDGTETVQAWECDEECPVFLLDQQSGERPGFSTQRDLKASDTFGGPIYGNGKMLQPGVREGFNDKGGASRFYYTAKAGRNERITVDGEQHPTVKPLALMRWLVRLVTPPGGTVLDPFCGSGSTLVAAAMEGFRAIGVEADERWCRGSAQRLTEIPPIQEALL